MSKMILIPSGRERPTLNPPMLDTSAFNWLFRDPQRERISEAFRVTHGRVFSTHIQRDELTRTADPYLRAMLLSLYDDLAVERPTADGVPGVSRIGAFRVSDGTGLQLALHGSMTSKVRIQTASSNRLRDAMIARTARANGAVLVHSDHRHMTSIAARLGSPHFTWPEFRERALAGSTVGI